MYDKHKINENETNKETFFLKKLIYSDLKFFSNVFYLESDLEVQKCTFVRSSKFFILILIKKNNH